MKDLDQENKIKKKKANRPKTAVQKNEDDDGEGDN